MIYTIIAFAPAGTIIILIVLGGLAGLLIPEPPPQPINRRIINDQD
jgi:hypothetical protein